MTQPTDFELLELATPYALHAVPDSERADIDRWVARAPASVAAAFEDEARAVRETMARLCRATAAEPPPQLRGAILALATPRSAKVRQLTWRTAALASAAAAVVVGAVAFGVGVLTRPTPKTPVAEQILHAPDVRTVPRPRANAMAPVMSSRDRNAAVLVMNNVPPPSPGTVYQMWLIDAKGPTSAGTMNSAAVAPSTPAMLTDPGSATTLAVTL